MLSEISMQITPRVIWWSWFLTFIPHLMINPLDFNTRGIKLALFNGYWNIPQIQIALSLRAGLTGIGRQFKCRSLTIFLYFLELQVWYKGKKWCLWNKIHRTPLVESAAWIHSAFGLTKSCSRPTRGILQILFHGHEFLLYHTTEASVEYTRYIPHPDIPPKK